MNDVNRTRRRSGERETRMQRWITRAMPLTVWHGLRNRPSRDVSPPVADLAVTAVALQGRRAGYDA